MVDGREVTCPGDDGKTLCGPAPDGCNTCWCWNYTGIDAGFQRVCTSEPCPDAGQTD